MYPSLYEPFGLVQLEAMGLRVPGHWCKLGAIPEVAGATLLFDPHKLEDVAEWYPAP